MALGSTAEVRRQLRLKKRAMQSLAARFGREVSNELQLHRDKRIFSAKRQIDQHSEGGALRSSSGGVAAASQSGKKELTAITSRNGNNNNSKPGGVNHKRTQKTKVVLTEARTEEEEERSSDDSDTVIIEDNTLLDISALDDVTPADPSRLQGRDRDGAIQASSKVRFADACGEALEDVHYTQTMYTHETMSHMSQVIVLLLNPKQKKFEFIHMAYDPYQKMPIAQIMAKLPQICTHKSLADQTYVGLCRVAANGRELINTVSIQGYELDKDEVLVAIIKGSSAKYTMEMASPLLSNRRILKAVKRSRVSTKVTMLVDPTLAKEQPAKEKTRNTPVSTIVIQRSGSPTDSVGSNDSSGDSSNADSVTANDPVPPIATAVSRPESLGRAVPNKSDAPASSPNLVEETTMPPLSSSSSSLSSLSLMNKNKKKKKNTNTKPPKEPSEQEGKPKKSPLKRVLSFGSLKKARCIPKADDFHDMYLDELNQMLDDEDYQHTVYHGQQHQEERGRGEEEEEEYNNNNNNEGIANHPENLEYDDYLYNDSEDMGSYGYEQYNQPSPGISNEKANIVRALGFGLIAGIALGVPGRRNRRRGRKDRF